tara:strand:+ start:378 stop:608 length:231 start_codon:yes stop_codon:yes gene_type:complete
MAPDSKNPFTCQEVYDNLHIELNNLINQERVKVMIIPDIESINYGRGVGYEIIEHIPPKKVGEISATDIRKKLFNK